MEVKLTASSGAMRGTRGGCRAITVDHRARTLSVESHHRTEGQEPAHGPEPDVRPLLSTVEALGCEPPFALGHSNGTYFTMWLTSAIVSQGLVSS